MWEAYRYLARHCCYPWISKDKARHLILEAQNGSKESKDELILRHIRFLMFKVYKRLFPETLKRYGEDILAEVILHTYEKINTYDLNHCDKQGNPSPVKFTTYIWKDIDGFILQLLKKESGLRKTQREYCKNEQLYERNVEFNGYKRNKINHKKNQRWRPI